MCWERREVVLGLYAQPLEGAAGGYAQGCPPRTYPPRSPRPASRATKAWAVFAATSRQASHLPRFPRIERLCCREQSGKDGTWRGGFGIFHQLPVCGEASGDDLVVEAEPEDLDGYAGPSGPRARVRRDQATFSGMRYSTPLLPPERFRVVTRAILAVFYLRGRAGVRGRAHTMVRRWNRADHAEGFRARGLPRLLLAGLVEAHARDLKPVRSIAWRARRLRKYMVLW